MVQSTHEVLVGERTVRKRYRSWLRGEHDREWSGLTLMHRWCPGLAPEPLQRGPEEMVPDLRAWIRQPHQPVSVLVERALMEAGKWLHGPEISSLTRESAEPVFTQADGNLGNVLWDGARCSVVDFEDCGVSDPAYEVADLAEHVSVWLLMLLPGNAGHARNPAGSVERQADRLLSLLADGASGR
jgi:hypothetical protein